MSFLNPNDRRARLAAGVSLVAIAALLGGAGSASADPLIITTDTLVTDQSQLDQLGDDIFITAPNGLGVVSGDDLLFSGDIVNENPAWTSDNNYGSFLKGGLGTLTLHDTSILGGSTYVGAGTSRLVRASTVTAP
jgi:hypothetical protein